MYAFAEIQCSQNKLCMCTVCLKCSALVLTKVYSISQIARWLMLSQGRLLPLKGVCVHVQYYDLCSHSIMSLVWCYPAGKVLCWCPQWASTRETLALSLWGAGNSIGSGQRKAWKGNWTLHWIFMYNDVYSLCTSINIYVLVIIHLILHVLILYQECIMHMYLQNYLWY